MLPICFTTLQVCLRLAQLKYLFPPSEAEYACRRRKDILPLRIQPKYNADGWFGKLIGAKMYFDFSREENLEVMMANLVRELGQRGKIRPEPQAEGISKFSHISLN